MTDAAAAPSDHRPPKAPATPPPGGQHHPTEGIEEIVLCSDDGQIIYEWPSFGEGGRVPLFNPIFKSSDALGKILSLGRPRRLAVETLDGRLILLLQPNRRLFVRTSVKRKET